MNRTAAIILAAGESRRFGKPKALLDWFGKSFIETIVNKAEVAGLDPIIVITGAYKEEIENICAKDSSTFLHNAQWRDGQSSTMILGVKEIEKLGIDQFIIFLCDQPQVTNDQIKILLDESNNQNVDIVFGKYNDKVTPPILFKKNCINSFYNLTGDQGAKSIFKYHNCKIIRYIDEWLTFDCDTEEEYQLLINHYNNAHSH